MSWPRARSEEHTSELQSPIDISYAVFCLKKKNFTPGVSSSKNRKSPALAAGMGVFFFFNDTATTEIYTSIDTLSLHDALPISETLGATSSSPSLRRRSACP